MHGISPSTITSPDKQDTCFCWYDKTEPFGTVPNLDSDVSTLFALLLPHNWENCGLCFHCRLLKNGRSFRGSSMSCSGVVIGLKSFDETPSTLRLSVELACRFGFGFCTTTSSIGRFGMPSCLDGTCHDYTSTQQKHTHKYILQCNASRRSCSRTARAYYTVDLRAIYVVWRWTHCDL